MDNYIKHLKPRKNGRFHQGVIDPNKLSKYANSCKTEPVIYRSALELQFIQYCESNTKITKWASEPIEIKYFNRIKQKESRYFPDYIIENADGIRCIVEVKPENQTTKPTAMDSEWLKEAWIQNVDKWTAAKKFAEENGMKFVVVTEKFFE